MTKNVGGIDRVLRIVVGVALILAAVVGVLPVWGYIGFAPLLTGIVGWCPAYPLVGLNTNKCGGGEGGSCGCGH